MAQYVVIVADTMFHDRMINGQWIGNDTEGNGFVLILVIALAAG